LLRTRLPSTASFACVWPSPFPFRVIA
jgi:hypothetical protein